MNGCMSSNKHCMPAENGIAPLTPSRGKLSAPFKLVAPNADMKDIPATFVVCTCLASRLSTASVGRHYLVTKLPACLFWMKFGP